MFGIKRLYTFMLQTFLPMFLMTFGICLFIVLMQFLWKYIDDMVGKGLELSVLGEMFFYAALSLVPMALPLAILLASLMTFGDLGERLELLAMKSAGVSLFRIMRPLIITLSFVSVGAFFFQNNVMPVANVKLYALLYSMRAKSPELDIPEGVFYNEITGYSVYVKDKDKENGQLRDVMIYDYSKGFNNADVIVADSGRLKTSDDKLFLVLSLYEGESFGNLEEQKGNTRNQTAAIPYRRETFKQKEILIEFDANFARTDESFLQNQYLGKNLEDLQHSIDSMSLRLDSITSVNSKAIYNNSYKRSLQNQSSPRNRPQTDTEQEPDLPVAGEPVIVFNYDSVYNAQKPADQAAILGRAKSNMNNTNTEYKFKGEVLGEEALRLRRHLTEWHKKFTVSFACMIFFFIGAPLGAIIRKGGLGMPVVISVILFIIYYIIDTFGFKMAKDGIWEAWQGMWLSSFVLAPLGIFLTYKAINDSVILNADTYLNGIKRFFGGRPGRKIERKEVIMDIPDYKSLQERLKNLSQTAGAYIVNNPRGKGMGYINFWLNGNIYHPVEPIAKEMESIVEELSNSDQILILNKLMDFPTLDGYNQFMIRIGGFAGMVIGILFPIGYPVFYLVSYKHKFLLKDMETIRKVSDELYTLVYALK